MLHTTAYIKPYALEILGGGRILTKNEDLPPMLARIVAGVFKNRVGEDLEVGKQSVYYPYVVVNSMPTDLAVIVLAWWTPQREGHWNEVLNDLNWCFGWDPSLRVVARLVIIGDPRTQLASRRPARQRTDSYDLGQGTPGP